MKNAPFGVLILLLCANLIACKNRPETKSDTVPAKEVEIKPLEKSSDKKELPSYITPIPKEQKTDRKIRQKKGINALDTLRPRTA